MVKLLGGKHLFGGHVELFQTREKEGGGHVVIDKTTGENAHLFLSKSCLKKRKQLVDDVFVRTLLWGAGKTRWVGTFRLTADIQHPHKKTVAPLFGDGTYVEAKKSSGTYRLSCGTEFTWPRQIKTCKSPLSKTTRTLRFWLVPGKMFIVCSWVTKEPVWEDTCFALMERENRALSEWNWNGIDDLFEVK